MAYTNEQLKVLGQLSPSATTLTDMYTVPANRDASISSIVVANRASSAASFRISIALAGAADNVKQYLYYDLPIPANETFIATVGLSISTTDIVRVYSSTTTLSFSLFGSEVTF